MNETYKGICLLLISFDKHKWTIMSPMITAVSNPIVLVTDNKLYACGGYNGSFQKTVQCYDTLTSKWTSVSINISYLFCVMQHVFVIL